MSKIELVKLAFNLDNPDQYSCFSDDFQWTDELGSPPMDKDAWFAMDQPLRSALPDLSFVIEEIREEGDGVVMSGRFSGTFNDLDLSAWGMGVIPATGKAVAFPTTTDRLSFDNGRISKMHGLDTGPDAGTAGFLKAFGVDLG
jgi:predicted ester cyclase